MTELPASMRAVRLHSTGGIDALHVERVPVPQPGEGEVLVKAAAAGVNFIDIYKRKGLYRIPLPATLGEEGAGTVVAVGAGVTEVSEGQRVAWSSVLGSYAEYAIVPLARLAPVPEGVDSATAAAVMLQGMTAHYLANDTFPLREGHRCLVHAAAGGVGMLLVQVARRMGAYVIGTAGSEEKAALARQAGAHEVVVYTRSDFVAEVKRITDGSGVHVVFDSVGQDTFLPGLDLLAPRGMMVLFGQSSGPVAPLDPQVLNQKGSLFLTRPTLGHYTASRGELLARAQDLFEWIAAGQLSVRVGAEFELADAAAAQAALEGRQTTGKVLLRVASA